MINHVIRSFLLREMSTPAKRKTGKEENRKIGKKKLVSTKDSRASQQAHHINQQGLHCHDSTLLKGREAGFCGDHISRLDAKPELSPGATKHHQAVPHQAKA